MDGGMRREAARSWSSKGWLIRSERLGDRQTHTLCCEIAEANSGGDRMQWHKIPMGVLNAVSILALFPPSLMLSPSLSVRTARWHWFIWVHIWWLFTPKAAVPIFLPTLPGSFYLPGLLHVMHSRRWWHPLCYRRQFHYEAAVQNGPRGVVTHAVAPWRAKGLEERWGLERRKEMSKDWRKGHGKKRKEMRAWSSWVALKVEPLEKCTFLPPLQLRFTPMSAGSNFWQSAGILQKSGGGCILYEVKCRVSPDEGFS